jgi:hypothetical protein
MRLVNVHTLGLESLLPGRIPRYAILSHTWGNDEILFADMAAERATIVERTGYAKIVDCCAQIRKRRPDLDYVWIDTCCIDKSSSAELSEAINSMYVTLYDSFVPNTLTNHGKGSDTTHRLRIVLFFSKIMKKVYDL